MKSLTTLYTQLILALLLTLFLGSADAGQPVLTISPNAISNTYVGPIALQITGLTNGETVTIQKYIDLNADGVVDGGDFLCQQFQLTDGQASVFNDGATSVTNLYIPGDLDGSANGQITATLYPSLDFSQVIVANYLFVLSSPVGHFSPYTNSFSVTNFPFAQSFSGNVVSNSTPVPYAGVLLFAPQSGSGGGGNPVGGVVANGSGAYSIMAPPGTYQLAAFKPGFVANLAVDPNPTLFAGVPVVTNIPLMSATQTISGKVVDANNLNLGLAGFLVPVESTDNLLALAFTDTNGNFTTYVTPDQWKIQSDESALQIKGYLSSQNKTKVDTGTGSVSGVTIPLQKETAIFYGKVADTLGNPLAGVDIYTSDDNGSNQADVYTLASGNYFAPALAGSTDPWQIYYGGSGPANYIYTQADVDNNGGTNLNAGQALSQNFTGLFATNTISGNVQVSGGGPLSNLGVNASQTINSVYFNSHADTDGNGNYSLPVANGYTWNVSVNCGSGGDGLGNFGNYECPNSTNVTINNDDGTADFVVSNCPGVQIFTTSLPAGQVGNYYDIFLMGSTCNGNQVWSLMDPLDFPSSLTFNSDGEIFGTPDTATTYNFTVQLSDGNGNSATQLVSLTINIGGAPLQIITSSPIPNGTNGFAYSYLLQATGGTPPYSWSIPDFSAALPFDLGLATNGLISGTPSTSTGYDYFDVIVTDAASDTDEWDTFMVIVNPPLPPLVITNTVLPKGTVGAPYSAQLGATGGQSPYNWSLALGSANPPSGLTLSSSGMITGTPTNVTVGAFKVQVNDMASDVTNKVYTITINPKPVLSAVNWLTNQFRMLLTGASNQNYTVQSSTNLHSANWASLFVTNNAATNSFIVLDSHATNTPRFYRLLIGP